MSLREVDRGLIEAAQAMGAERRHIIRHVLLPEALPGILGGFTITVVAMIGSSAMAGAVGAGGLGDLAIRYGYQRFDTTVMVTVIVLLIAIVERRAMGRRSPGAPHHSTYGIIAMYRIDLGERMNAPHGPARLELTELVAALRETAEARDRDGGHAAREKQLIADAGLLTIAVPREFGGEGARWVDVYETIRALARVDSALAHLLGFTCLQVVSVTVWGNEAQRERYLRGTVAHRWWWGNAVNPLDTRLIAHATGDGGYRLSGQKGFCSGTRGSQMMTLSAHDPATGKPIFAVVPTTREGITVHDDWDPVGQRQTDSGSVSFDDVELRDR